MRWLIYLLVVAVMPAVAYDRVTGEPFASHWPPR